MTTTITIGLALGGEFTRMTVLDAVGELLEETNVRSTEAGFRQRFAHLPPSLIAAEYDHRHAHLLAMLSAMGHRVLLTGNVPAHLRPALTPSVQQFLDQGRRHGAAARSLMLQTPGPGVRMGFWVDVDAEGKEIVPSWYFIGPIPPGTDLSAAPLAGFAAVAGVSSHEQARRLHLLTTVGELSVDLVPPQAAPRDVAA